MSDLPKILYKYRSFDLDEYHIRVIQDGALWFTSACSFNDPFDSSLQFSFEDNPMGIRRKWVNMYLKRTQPQLSRAARRRLVSQRLREMKKPDHLERFKHEHVLRNYKEFGMCCLTPKKDNLLMWAHYGSNHEGFCVGLDNLKLKEFREELAYRDILITQEKIRYEKSMPQINFYSAALEDGWYEKIMELLCTKSTHWKYEEEYRLIYWHKVDISIPLDPDIFAEVVLGCRISKKNQSMIIDKVKNLNPKIKIYQAIKAESDFKLLFEYVA